MSEDRFSLKFTLHTLIHTFAFEAKLQYLGLNLEDAESVTPLFFLNILCLSKSQQSVD